MSESLKPSHRAHESYYRLLLTTPWTSPSGNKEENGKPRGLQYLQLPKRDILSRMRGPVPGNSVGGLSFPPSFLQERRNSFGVWEISIPFWRGWGQQVQVVRTGGWELGLSSLTYLIGYNNPLFPSFPSSPLFPSEFPLRISHPESRRSLIKDH